MSAKEPILRVVCAWCDAVKVEGDPDGGISHGICGPCRDAILAKWGLPSPEAALEEANTRLQLAEA